MTAPTFLRPFRLPKTPSAWRTGLHRLEEDSLGSLDQRVAFVRNALALVQPMSVLELGTDPALRDRLAREGHSVYASAPMQAAAASFPHQVQRITGVTHYFGYGDTHAVAEALPTLAGRLSPWGWMGLKILDRDQIAQWLPDEEVVHRDGAWFRLRFRFDRRSGMLDLTSRPLGASGQSQGNPTRLRLRSYTVTEIESQLQAHGLKLEALFGGWEGEPSGRGKALWLIARKNAAKK